LNNSFTPNFPIVVKVAHVHAGYGKMKLENHHQLADLRSIVSIHNDYCTAESFLKGDYDLRIQKIGKRIRAFRRTGISGAWKTNTGSAILEHIEVTRQHKDWIDACANVLGGMDIFALDVLHTQDGKDYILELNGTSIGLAPETFYEDSVLIAELVAERAIGIARSGFDAPHSKIENKH